jgi:hypothetical protein
MYEKEEEAEKPKKRAYKKAEPEVVLVAAKEEKAMPDKRYSFEQWASRNGVPVRHRRGMRAFVKNPDSNRTLVAWTECFKGY